jgi:hypothetical protein
MDNIDAVAQLMTNADAMELKLLDRGLRTNEPLSHDRTAIAHLIELKLAYSSGIAVRITPLGYEMLKRIP